VLLVSEGDTSLEEMIADMSEGLIVEALLGAGQGNVLGGDFNANVLLGYKVQDGKVVGRVKNTMVSGNVYKALSNLVAIGSEGRWMRGGLYAPPIALADISVSANG
jgi:PmbA protein